MAIISIVLPTFNGERFLRESVDSCLNQTFREIELIVVIDGSTDNTEHLMQQYDDPRLVVIKTENRGQAEAMNRGFSEASGKYWSWSSDDNVYMPEAFEIMWSYLQKHEEFAAVSTDGLVIDEKGRRIGYQEFSWQCFLYRADVAGKIPVHRSEARILEDIDFFLRLKHYGGPIGRISRPYIKYRVHKHMVSHTRIKERPLISVKLNYEYITCGMTQGDMEAMFMDRLSQCALHRAYDTMDGIMVFAREKNVPFLNALERKNLFLRTPVGWLQNRLYIAARSQLGKIRSRLKLLHYLTLSQWSFYNSND